MWARSYLWVSTWHETHTTIDGVVCESIIVETNAPQQSLTIVVLCRIHALMMASNAWVKRSATGARQVSPIPTWHKQKPPRSVSTGHNYTFACLSICHVFPQICHLPNPLQSSLRKAMKNKSKFSLTLLCKRTVTSQQKFDGQNGVPREIGTRAQTVKESEPKW